MSARERGWATLLVAVLLVVGPSAASLLWYAATGNPLLRPLGITRESIRAFDGGGDGTGIVALVDWDKNRAGQVTQADMTRALTNAFSVKGIDVWVVFRESDSGTQVTYKVGRSVIGPYPQSRAAEGIPAAAEAYHMNASR
ncbi:MAG TPA: hypothetical protein ENK41_06090 [Rhodobacteraceae bacterium]|nr:hypothetical protein [Paracoccaceae bacterium]